MIDPYKELLDRFITENEDYSEYRDNFVCDFASLKDVVDYYSDWWEQKYEDLGMTYEDILHEWREKNNIRCALFEGRYLLFGGVEL
jgi:hypothetical protein